MQLNETYEVCNPVGLQECHQALTAKQLAAAPSSSQWRPLSYVTELQLLVSMGTQPVLTAWRIQAEDHWMLFLQASLFCTSWVYSPGVVAWRHRQHEAPEQNLPAGEQHLRIPVAQDFVVESHENMRLPCWELLLATSTHPLSELLWEVLATWQLRGLSAFFARASPVIHGLHEAKASEVSLCGSVRLGVSSSAAVPAKTSAASKLSARMAEALLPDMIRPLDLAFSV